MATTLQLSEYVCTVNGWYFKHGIEDRHEFTEVTTLPISSKSYKGVLEDGDPEFNELRAPIQTMTAEEQAPPDPIRTTKCLLVGLSPAINDAEVLRLSPTRLKGKAIGMTDCTINEVDDNKDLTPLRVVVEITDNVLGPTKLYALLGCKNGLSQPFIIAQHEVFYFSEYRDNTTTTEGRRSAWNELIRKKSLRVDERTTEKQLVHRRHKDVTRLTLNPVKSAVNELVLLTAAFTKSKDTWMLEKIKDILKLAGSEDPNSNLLSNFPHLRNFVNKLDGEESFTESDAQSFIDEAIVKWENLKDLLTIDTVIRLKELLDNSEVELEYRFLQGYLILGTKELTKASHNANAGDFVEEIRTTLTAIIDRGTPRVSISEERGHALLNAVLEKLKEVSNASREARKEIQDLASDQILSNSLPEIFEAYCHSLDTDTAKLAFNQALRFGFGAIALKTEIVQKPIDELIDLLSRLLD